jgi:hypothetical protein
VVIGELRDAFGIFDVIHPFLGPLVQIGQEAIFVDLENFAFVFYIRHADISSLKNL